MQIFSDKISYFLEQFFNKILYYGLLSHTPVAQLVLVTTIKLVCILIAVAYFTLAERKAMAAIQRRVGPNVVGFWGLLQPLADGLKLLLKEIIIPVRANSILFLLAPLMVLTLSVVSWTVLPTVVEVSGQNILFTTYDEILYKSHTNFYKYKYNNYILELYNSIGTNILGLVQAITLFFNFFLNTFFQNSIWWINKTANISYGLLFILLISGLNVYGIIIAGWASNSKYAFLGALRSSAQMISYEVSLSLLILPVILLAGSLNFNEIVLAQQKFGWFVFPLFPCALIFFISMLAETNRAPFDLPEAEAELVAGYNVEYSSITFAMFFLAEYSNMLLMSNVLVVLFFGGWLPLIDFPMFFSGFVYFSIKIILICFLFVLVRACLPRYRYDQLMELGWKTYLPFTLSFFIFISGLLITFHALPYNLTVWPNLYLENNFFSF